ncbi:MAG: HEPN domain-containing protein [Candidatus Heimdallarchaeota archaeon]
MKEIIDSIEKAEKFLQTADLVLKHGDFDTCVSRCYFAMYFMVESVLLTENIRANSHKRVISFFGQHFIKTGIFDKELGKAINEVYDKRLFGDYSIGFAITEAEAVKQIEKARNFVAELKDFLEKKVTK